ncbi:hypothetical protein LZ633_06755 [Enterobacter asburiae]|nr:hypothetical protein [Enterobacter asburiae]
MSEDEIIKIMYEKKFSKKQIDNLLKVSKKYSTSLYEMVSELSQRFPRSMFIHFFILFLAVFSYIRYSHEHGHSLGGALASVITLGATYIVLNFFAPLLQGYKARKVIREIHKNKPRNNALS